MRSKEGDQCVVCMGVLMGKWKHSGPAICPLSGGKRGGGRDGRAEVCTQGSHGTSEVTCAFH